MTNPVHPQYQCIVASPFLGGPRVEVDATIDTMASALSMDQGFHAGDGAFWAHGKRSLAANSAHMWLWVPDSTFLRPGLRVLEELSFHYLRTIVWAKTDGPAIRGGIELCLFGVRIHQAVWHPTGGRPIEFAPSTGPHPHSPKPQKFYDRFREESPGPYLEMFAQGKREGWDTWAPTPDPPAAEVTS